MEAQAIPQQQFKTQATMDKAFFGKDNCLTVQLVNKNCFFKFGKKVGEQWNWKGIKFSDMELGEIVRVLVGEQKEAKFFHTFKEENTQIWVSKIENKVILKVGDYTKGLNPGEQKVLETLLNHIIWMMNIT